MWNCLDAGSEGRVIKVGGGELFRWMPRHRWAVQVVESELIIRHVQALHLLSSHLHLLSLRTFPSPPSPPYIMYLPHPTSHRLQVVQTEVITWQMQAITPPLSPPPLRNPTHPPIYHCPSRAPYPRWWRRS